MFSYAGIIRFRLNGYDLSRITLTQHPAISININRGRHRFQTVVSIFSAGDRFSATLSAADIDIGVFLLYNYFIDKVKDKPHL